METSYNKRTNFQPFLSTAKIVTNSLWGSCNTNYNKPPYMYCKSFALCNTAE